MSEAADVAALAHLLDQEDDLDSEDLDRLEDEAEEELLADMQQEGIEAPSSPSSSDDTDYVFGPMSQEDVQCILADLRAHGMMECLQRHILPAPSKAATLDDGGCRVRSLFSIACTQDDIYADVCAHSLYRLRQRQKLPQYNTVTDVLDLLRRSKRIVVLCGAGISVSCGHLCQDGLYAILAKENQYELDDPSDMFDKDTFLRDPSMFYSFAHSIYPAHFEPSPSHHFVRKLEMQGKLLRMYSQNIDTLEQKAGIQRVVQCHGSFATATCTDPRCGYHADGESIRADILAKRVPSCPRCDERRERERANAKRRKVASDEEEDDDGLAYGIMKPDITFFGEKVRGVSNASCLMRSSKVRVVTHTGVWADRDQVDLILVMGTSLKVAPVADLLTHLPPTVPTVLINRTPITHMALDVMLLGDSDGVVQYLEERLYGPCPDTRPMDEPRRVGDSHIWLFPGAELCEGENETSSPAERK